VLNAQPAAAEVGILLQADSSFTMRISQSSYCWWHSVFFMYRSPSVFISLHYMHCSFCYFALAPYPSRPPGEANSRSVNPAGTYLCPAIWLLWRSYWLSSRSSSKPEHFSGCLWYSQISMQSPYQSVWHFRLASDFSCVYIC